MESSRFRGSGKWPRWEPCARAAQTFQIARQAGRTISSGPHRDNEEASVVRPDVGELPARVDLAAHHPPLSKVVAVARHAGAAVPALAHLERVRPAVHRLPARARRLAHPHRVRALCSTARSVSERRPTSKAVRKRRAHRGSRGQASTRAVPNATQPPLFLGRFSPPNFAHFTPFFARFAPSFRRSFAVSGFLAPRNSGG